MKFFALLIAAVAANQADITNLVALQDIRQSDGPSPAPQRMAGVNGSVASIPAKKQRWTDAPLLKPAALVV